MYKNNLVTQIVAVNNLGYIGKDDKLMWHCKEDLEHFKKTTMWNVLIVGRKTLDTLPKAVQQGRYLISVSRSGNSIEEAFEKADNVANNDSIYVIGGGEIYKATQDQTDFILLSRINNNDIGDTQYEVPDNFELTTSHKMNDSGDENSLYQIEIYKRKTESKSIDLIVENNDSDVCLMPTGTFELSTSTNEPELIVSIKDGGFGIPTGYNNRTQGYDGFVIETTKQKILLGISSGQSCCEETGYFMSLDDLDSFIGAEILDLEITDTAYNTHEVNRNIGFDRWEGGIMFVNILTSKGKFQFVTYNLHNGYYGHDAIVQSTQLDYGEII